MAFGQCSGEEACCGLQGRVAFQPHSSPTDRLVLVVFDEHCRSPSVGNASAARFATGLEIRRWGNPSVGSNPTLYASQILCLGPLTIS